MPIPNIPAIVGARGVAILRFLNMMDPGETIQLSPTRIQAWAATITSYMAIFHAVVSTSTNIAETAGNAAVAGIAAAWAHKSQQTYTQHKQAGK